MQACEVVDKCVQELMDAIDEANGRWLVTSDHGNADDMVQRTKKGEPIKEDSGRPIPLTSHTLAPVGVAVGGKGLPEGVQARFHLLPCAVASVLTGVALQHAAIQCSVCSLSRLCTSACWTFGGQCENL